MTEPERKARKEIETGNDTRNEHRDERETDDW